MNMGLLKTQGNSFNSPGKDSGSKSELSPRLSRKARSQLLTLQRIDLLRIRNWFRSHAGTKLLVILGFLLIMVFTIVFEFIMAHAFFKFAATQGEFGKAVTQYSLNAAILVLFLLSTISSLASSNHSLYKPDFLRFLQAVPLSSRKLFWSRLLTSLNSSIWLVLIFLSPLLLAFRINFHQSPQFILRALVSLVMLVIVSHAIGAMGAVLMVSKFGKVTRKMMASLFVFFISGSMLLMRLLFPPSFFRLYYAADWPAFQKQLGALPLLSTKIPTNWFALTITDNWSVATLLALLLTLTVLVITDRIGKTWYLSSWRNNHEGYFLAGTKLPKVKNISNYPKPFKSSLGVLFNKEILSVFRSPGEMSYLAFLSGLIVAILFLIRNIPALSQAKSEFIPAVLALSLVGFSYLSMIIDTRLIYPSMAREKKTSWLLFSLPITRKKILYSKILFAVAVAFPAIFIGFIAGWLAQLSFPIFISYALILFITSTIVSLIQLFIGTISPNFMEADNVDAASTSGSGLAAIVFSLVIISISGYMVYAVVQGVMTFSIALYIILISAALILTPLYLLARKNIYRYDL